MFNWLYRTCLGVVGIVLLLSVCLFVLLVFNIFENVVTMQYYLF